MRIYNVDLDMNNVQVLNLVDQTKDILELLNFDCEPRGESWTPLETYVFNPKIKAKNFFALPAGVLVCDEKALVACRTIFEMAGEILPIKVERGPELYIINILECMNGLDYNKTVWDYYSDGTKGRILKHHFISDRVINSSTLFKIPETSKTEIFTFSGIMDSSDEFFHVYNDNGLTGLKFIEMSC